MKYDDAYRLAIVKALVWSVIALSSLSLVGHLTGVKFLFQQFGPVGMAANTAFCLLATSVAIILVSRGE